MKENCLQCLQQKKQKQCLKVERVELILFGNN